MQKQHSFHIPVMGIGFTLDTPLKVSQYGIDSVISLVDDILLERLRKMYCEKYQLQYQEISKKVKDFRAKRITSYLNLINKLAEKKFVDLKNSVNDVTQKNYEKLKSYFDLLPDSSEVKRGFLDYVDKLAPKTDFINQFRNNLSMGSIDVNIMTKVDRENFDKNVKLPVIYNDAHAALRGYANSNLNSSLILSAGMNPRLYAYLEEFEDFYPDKSGFIKKKIILKVSDYRSAFIQGRYLAKKGLWISEYRIESGLNCGGHAFATDGYLLGPVLEEFKSKKTELTQTLYEIFIKAIEAKNKVLPNKILPIRITAQGGVGTAEEHQFLLKHYNIDSVGWGTPFLLVPEATAVDKDTINTLTKAKEEDIYLSDISPLGVPFYSLKSNTKDIEKAKRIALGKPGSPCPKKFVALNKEFSEKGMCTASRQYQNLKIKELEGQNLPKNEFKKHFDKIVEKACTCVGLGTSALLAYDLDTKIEGKGVSICPGPDMAYFSKIISLKEMVQHIYGKTNVISRTDRPNMFVKELDIYINYLKNKITETKENINTKQVKYLNTFANNLTEGVEYYQKMFTDISDSFIDIKTEIFKSLSDGKNELTNLKLEINNLI